MKRSLIVAGTIALLGVGHAAAGENVPPKQDENISLTDTAPLTSMSREPMWLINCFSGKRDSVHHREEDYTGLRGEWRGEEAMDWLEDQLRYAYGLGARRFWIVRPMGTDGESNVPAAAWLTIPEYKREPMEERINRLILQEFDEPVEIYYFIGTWMEDPWSLRGLTPTNQDEAFRLGDDEYEAQIATRITLGGLMSAGASGFGFDASALTVCRDHYMDLAEQLRRPPFNLQSVGEALPVVPTPNGRGVVRDANGDFKLDDEALRRMAWVGTSDYLYYRFKFREFDPETTRVFHWYPSGDEYRDLGDEGRRDLIRADIRRGWIPICHDEVMFKAALQYTANPALVEQQDPAPKTSTDPIPRFTLVD